MSLPITVKADYKGKVRISTQKGSQFDEYITEYEREYLTELINVEVYNDIKDNDPIAQKYTDLIDGVQYTDDNGDLIDYRGLKRMLLRFIYAEYNADNFQTSIGGNVRSVNENSTVLNAENYVIVKQRFNEAVSMYRDEVYKFLDEHETLKQEITNSVVGGGFTTYSVDSTQYLYDGDTVTINGTEYTITNVVTDTSFDITGVSNDFTGQEAIYTPFYEIEFKNIKYSGLI